MKKDIRHFVLETKELGTFDVVEYKEYQELQEIIDKAIEWVFYQQEHSMEPYISTDMLDDLLEILKGEDKE